MRVACECVIRPLEKIVGRQLSDMFHIEPGIILTYRLFRPLWCCGEHWDGLQSFIQTTLITSQVWPGVGSWTA